MINLNDPPDIEPDEIENGADEAERFSDWMNDQAERQLDEQVEYDY
jgi:hypothetical protein